MSAVPYRRTFVRLLGFLRPYRVSLVVSIFLAVASQGAQIALVWMTKRVIDGALRPHDDHKLWLFFWLILSYPALYYVVFPHPRYRHPIEPELGILIVYVISETEKRRVDVN